MARDREATEKTKKFLQSNIRSAQWIVDAIEQAAADDSVRVVGITGIGELMMSCTQCARHKYRFIGIFREHRISQPESDRYC